MDTTMRRWVALGWLALGSLPLGACVSEDPFSDDGLGDDYGPGADYEPTSGGGPGGGISADDGPQGEGDGGGEGEGEGGGATEGGDGSGDAGSSGGDEGPAACLPAPTRLVVLGDSIFACFGNGGKDADTCSAKAFHGHMQGLTGALSYENLAVNGAVTRDVAQSQLGQVETGKPGHVLVLVFIGGNDLSPFIFQSDAATEQGYAQKRPELDGYWSEIFAFFDDPAKFPDGTTIFMNTQYNPFDECQAAPYETMTEVKHDLLRDYNEDLKVKAAARDNAYIVDQFASYLGHGHHFDKGQCPHYSQGAAGWMFDLIHPNNAGHANLAAQLRLVANSLYADCMPE